ncbi:MAG: hypothetical protein IKV36_00270 [Clostridia bacterium]|nr:hypothetical protein [Clostridia bacterium]
MQSAIPTIALGILLIVLGYFNTKGNITAIHSYHRKRVTEEDRIPFGKRVGIGNIIIGIAIIIYGAIFWINELLKNDILNIVGIVIMLLGLAIGLAISFSAMIKYNKGIF